MNKLILLFIILSQCGCAISKINRPPEWASVISSHARFTGLDASIPMGSGTSVGIKFGFGSTVWVVLPASTNKVYIPQISETFSLAEGAQPWNVTIKEYLSTSWGDGPPPQPAMQLFNQPTITNKPKP